MTKSANVLAMTPFDGAKTQLYAAASPEVDELDLKYVLTAEPFDTTLSELSNQPEPPILSPSRPYQTLLNTLKIRCLLNNSGISPIDCLRVRLSRIARMYIVVRDDWSDSADLMFVEK